jgi:DNA modification methylase
MCTEPGDLVVDFFGGSNTTGRAAEDLGRRWLSFELDRSYAAESVVRFVGNQESTKVLASIEQMAKGQALVVDDPG